MNAAIAQRAIAKNNACRCVHCTHACHRHLCIRSTLAAARAADRPIVRTRLGNHVVCARFASTFFLIPCTVGHLSTCAKELTKIPLFYSNELNIKLRDVGCDVYDFLLVHTRRGVELCIVAAVMHRLYGRVSFDLGNCAWCYRFFHCARVMIIVCMPRVWPAEYVWWHAFFSSDIDG